MSLQSLHWAPCKTLDPVQAPAQALSPGHHQHSRTAAARERLDQWEAGAGGGCLTTAGSDWARAWLCGSDRECIVMEILTMPGLGRPRCCAWTHRWDRTLRRESQIWFKNNHLSASLCFIQSNIPIHCSFLYPLQSMNHQTAPDALWDSEQS